MINNHIQIVLLLLSMQLINNFHLRNCMSPSEDITFFKIKFTPLIMSIAKIKIQSEH